MTSQRGFSLLDCLIALAVSLMAASGTYALTRSAVTLYKQHQLDQVVADIADHLQAAAYRPGLTDGHSHFNRRGAQQERGGSIYTETRVQAPAGDWSVVEHQIDVHRDHGPRRPIRFKRLVWRP